MSSRTQAGSRMKPRLSASSASRSRPATSSRSTASFGNASCKYWPRIAAGRSSAAENASLTIVQRSGVIFFLPELAVEPHARGGLPLAPGHSFQFVERVVEVEHVGPVRTPDGIQKTFEERHALAFRPSGDFARVVDKHLAHRIRGGAEEVGAVRRMQRLPGEELEIGLVHKRRWLQRVIAPFPRHHALRHSVELIVDQRDQLRFGNFAAGRDFVQQQSDLFVRLIRRVLAVFGERQNGGYPLWPRTYLNCIDWCKRARADHEGHPREYISGICAAAASKP